MSGENRKTGPDPRDALPIEDVEPCGLCGGPSAHTIEAWSDEPDKSTRLLGTLYRCDACLGLEERTGWRGKAFRGPIN